MNQNNIASIKTHLEFLGYSIQEIEQALIARSDSKPNFFVFHGNPQYVVFQSEWNQVKNIDSHEQLDYLNKTNKAYDLVKIFFNFDEKSKENNINFRFAYTGEYNKKTFGDIFDFCVNTIYSVIRDEEFKKLFLKK